MLDKISYLPEEIRDRVLSYLPTTDEAVRTRVLSTQWKKVCFTLSQYQFNQLYFQRKQEYNNNQRFRDLLMQTLSLHDSRSHINTLKINAIFDDALLPCINTWISFSVLLNIRELELFLHRQTLHLNKLACSFFTCKTLQVLTLRNIKLILPRNRIIEFPRLKTLSLTFIEFMDDKSETDRFFASFPALEYLCMVHCKLEHALTVDSHKLKVLDMDKVYIGGEIRISSTVFNQILYNGYLNMYGGRVLPNIDLNAHSNLYHASFTATDYPASKELPKIMRIKAAKKLAGPNHIVKLALLGSCVQLLARDPDLIYHLPTSSPSVKHLQLQVNDCTKSHALAVTFLLRIYPNLETFSLLLKGPFDSGVDLGPESYRGSENLSTTDILGSLRIVTIKSLGGNDNELNLVRFLLENASIMEKMNILETCKTYWRSHKKVEETSGMEEYETFRTTIVNKIHSFSRASPLVAVYFSPE